MGRETFTAGLSVPPTTRGFSLPEVPLPDPEFRVPPTVPVAGVGQDAEHKLAEPAKIKQASPAQRRHTDAVLLLPGLSFFSIDEVTEITRIRLKIRSDASGISFGTPVRDSAV